MDRDQVYAVETSEGDDLGAFNEPERAVEAIVDFYNDAVAESEEDFLDIEDLSVKYLVSEEEYTTDDLNMESIKKRLKHGIEIQIVFFADPDAEGATIHPVPVC